MPHDVRDQVVDFVRCRPEKTEIAVGRFIDRLGVTASKFYDWRQRDGRVNEHNGWVPRDFWLERWEKEAIISFQWRRFILNVTGERSDQSRAVLITNWPARLKK